MRVRHIVLALMLMIGNGGCAPVLSETQEQMRELERRYVMGAISKQDYERQRAELHEKRQREIVQSGSTLNESVRGMLNDSVRSSVLSPP